MLGLLVGDTSPVLTQSQAFDNRYILEVLERADDESRGFLRLVRMGAIGVRFHDHAKLPSIAEPHTLTNAFASALIRQDDFVLSGWPELNGKHALRAELANILCRADPGQNPHRRTKAVLNNVQSLAGEPVAQRLSGLLELHRALADAGTPILTRPVAAGTYQAKVIALLQNLRSRMTEAQEPVAWLLSHADPVGRNPLDSRSAWVQLINIYRDAHPQSAGVLQEAEDAVTFAAHRLLAESLGSTGGEIDATSRDEATGWADAMADGSIAVNRLITLSRDPARTKWLTWDKVSAIWEDLRQDALPPNERLEALISRHKDFIYTESTSNKLTEVSVSLSLPMITTGFVATTIDNYVSNNVAGIVGAAAGAAASGMCMVLAGRMLSMPGEERLSQYLRQRSDQRWEASVSTGTASWQDEIGT